jgi:hypothetical protein
MRNDLGISPQCHSFRENCVRKYSTAASDGVFAAAGAAIGYCQALFDRKNTPGEHTDYVNQQLALINAPWPNSHELFWGYRDRWKADEYLTDAIKPLCGRGRVPILITGLDPAYQEDEIQTILRTSPPVVPGEPVLIRLLLSDSRSIDSAANLLLKLFEAAQKSRMMPTWWPLFQGDLSEQKWTLFKKSLGDLWRYSNLAINPFVPKESLAVIWEQVTVAQLPIGLESGIQDDGIVSLVPGMRVTGIRDIWTYSFFKFMDDIRSLKISPTLIVLGPSSPDWPSEWNTLRVKKFIPLLIEGTKILWQRLGKERQEALLKLPA